MNYKILTILIITIVTIMFFKAKDNDLLTTKINIEYFTLANGMDVILLPNHRVPAVMHMVWYKVGGIDEKLGKTGLAHYLEHLMFHGTKKYPKGVIDDLVSSFGGSHNAFTSYDFTAYYQNIPKKNLEELMDLEADRMRGLVLNEKDALIERDVVLEERLLRRDNSPQAVLSEKVREGLFSKSHPYGRPLIGYEDDISKLTFNDALSFYNKYYHPNNAILVLAGDISKAEVMPLIDKYYGALPAGKEVNISVAKKVAKVNKNVVKHYDENINNISLRLSYLAPDLLSVEKEHSYALSVASYLLGGGQNSILYKKLVIEKDLAINANVSYSDMSRGQSYFSINVTLKDVANEQQVINIIDEELNKLKLGKISKKDLEIAKNLFLIESVYSRESYESLAYIIGMNYTTGIDIEEILGWDKKIMEVTMLHIKEAIDFIFNKDKLTIGYLIPKKTK
jgi:zinc protease